jgi:biotin carboxyl carrier protein
VYSLLVNGRSHELRVTPGREGLEVTSHGTMIPVDVRHPLEKMLLAQAKAHGASGVETIVAPMPGLVVALRVKPGETVAAGHAVVVVEAMKMQNELTAKHAGTVTEVLVAERASVQAGQPLVRLHSEGS